MMQMQTVSRATQRRARRAFSNNNDAFIPEVWARYTVAILEKFMVAGRLVHRDFEAEVAEFGDTVNTRKPSSFTVDRKTDDDEIATQDVSATNIPVVLNMHPYVSFIIKDGEASLSMEALVERHLENAVKAMAEFIDASVTGQYAQFVKDGQVGGRLGSLTNANYQQYLTEVGEVMDNLNVPSDGRNLLVTPHTKAMFLQNQPLVGADQRGKLTALEKAEMGMIYGFQHYMTQSMRSVAAADITSSTFAVNNAAGYQIGDTVITVGTGTGSLADGQWVKILGRPYRIVSATDTLGNTTEITISPGLTQVLPHATVMTVYASADINFGSGAAGVYPVGYSKSIIYDGATILPKLGQAVTFGGQSVIYTIVQVTATKIWLDRALELALDENMTINVLPPGDYNMAFRRNAISLVCRPLEAPRPGSGAISTVVNHAGFPLRIVIAYDYKKQGHAVTIDNLMGIKTIDSLQGAVLLG